MLLWITKMLGGEEHAKTMDPAASRPKLLLVEDDQVTSAALRGILSMQGWDVVIAPTIAQAKMALRGRFDAVILDLMLPDGNGETVLELLRGKACAVPVAVTTGVSDDERIAAVVKMGATALLKKPIAVKDLLKVIGPPTQRATVGEC